MSTPETQSFNHEVISFLKPRVGTVTLTNPDIYGIHGCSWEAIVHLLRHGNFRGTAFDTSTLTPYMAGDISTYANPSHPFKDVNLTKSSYPDDQIIPHAKTYAGLSARIHALVSLLGYSLEDPRGQIVYEFGQQTPDPNETDMERLANQLGIPVDRVHQAVSTASSRKGFLIGFRQPSEDEKIGIFKGEDGGEIIFRPASEQRVNYQLIQVIQPLGEFEGVKLHEALSS